MEVLTAIVTVLHKVATLNEQDSWPVVSRVKILRTSVAKGRV
jgi:hypothetical protein